jgi:2-polyprenyl-3-methyl-5-hydroxy-6-metoxy-1,4-benzoquinol methylase
MRTRPMAILSRQAKQILDRRWWKYQWRYLRGQTPWDTQITPPEVMEFMAATPPGRALDLGCGTGTNAVSLTRHGWQVTGVDFVEQAIRTARCKARRAGLRIDFYTADVTQLDGRTGPFDYLLDIGCLISLPTASRCAYARTVSRLARPGGCYMLYGCMPRRFEGQAVGISPEQVEALLSPAFIRQRIAIGEEKGHPSVWYWYQRSAL